MNEQEKKVPELLREAAKTLRGMAKCASTQQEPVLNMTKLRGLLNGRSNDNSPTAA